MECGRLAARSADTVELSENPVVVFWPEVQDNKSEMNCEICDYFCCKIEWRFASQKRLFKSSRDCFLDIL